MRNPKESCYPRHRKAPAPPEVSPLTWDFAIGAECPHTQPTRVPADPGPLVRVASFSINRSDHLGGLREYRSLHSNEILSIDNLVRVSLLSEEALAPGGKLLLVGVAAHHCEETRLPTVCLRPQDPPEPLGLFLP